MQNAHTIIDRQDHQFGKPWADHDVLKDVPDLPRRRVSEAIAEQIRGLIRRKCLRPGDRLPGQPDLGKRWGVGLMSIREAMRALEAAGLIEMRRGSAAVVTTPSPTQVARGLAELIRVPQPTAAEVTEARLVFEISIIRSVVERATDDDITELREMAAPPSDRVRHGTDNTLASVAFHLRVASCTHNLAIDVIARSFHGPLLASLGNTNLDALVCSPRTAEHHDFVEAVAKRDVERCEQIMHNHLGISPKQHCM